MDSKVGLIIQLNGVFVVTVMCLLLSRSLRLTALRYWSVSWLCLSFALISLRLAFSYEAYGSLLFTYYYLGQYLFGLLLIAGCRSLDSGFTLRPRAELASIPFLILAVVLPQLSNEFADASIIHSLVMSGLYLTAFIALGKARSKGFGWKVMHVGLGGLGMASFVSAIALGFNTLQPLAIGLLMYSTLVELVLQTTVGVGMVLVLLENVLSDARSAHQRLETTNKRLEELVHTDPLTAAFSRHAFYGFVKKHGTENSETSGCVGFFDVDDLKWINDRYGHFAGDMVIRTVVRTIRETVRAEDLIFRWGGDEFFVIMISMDATMAAMRMAKFEEALTGIVIEGVPTPIDIGVSWGFKDFEDISRLEESINQADSEMYRRKMERKQRRRGEAEGVYVPEFSKTSPTLSA